MSIISAVGKVPKWGLIRNFGPAFNQFNPSPHRNLMTSEFVLQVQEHMRCHAPWSHTSGPCGRTVPSPTWFDAQSWQASKPFQKGPLRKSGGICPTSRAVVDQKPCIGLAWGSAWASSLGQGWARPSCQQLRMMWPPLSEAVWALRLVNPRRDKKSVSWNPPRTGSDRWFCLQGDWSCNKYQQITYICQSHKIMQILQRWFLGSPSLREQLYATHINSSN